MKFILEYKHRNALEQAKLTGLTDQIYIPTTLEDAPFQSSNGDFTL